jgi:putative hydrolase of the HAD superfamily
MAEEMTSGRMGTGHVQPAGAGGRPVTGVHIKAVLFDLGDTLLNYGRLNPYKSFMLAARQTYNYLKSIGQPVSWFPWYAIRSVVMVRWRVLWSAVTRKDFDSLRLLKRAGKNAGYNMTEEQYKELVWLWYEPLSRRVETEPDIHETLTQLKQKGLRLGIVSNTFVNACALNRDIAQRKLSEFFEFIYYSYEFERRKPCQAMFKAAIDALGLQPGEIAFVGDRLDTDVKGAAQAGMHIVLKQASANTGRKIPSGVVKIGTIAELPKAIDIIEHRAAMAQPCG